MRPFSLRATLKLTVLIAASFCARPLSAQTIAVTPDHVLQDETAAIRVKGLQPHEHVTIQATLVDGAEHRWSSEAEFIADAQGAVDVSQQAPVKGSYKDVSEMGLLWSMKPDDKHAARYASPRDFAAQSVEFHLIQGGKSASSAQLEQRTVAEGVHEVKVNGQLHGELFIPAASGPHPGVLVVGGSEGGLPTQKAAWLASHGFTALALAYFRFEDLPPELEEIPLEYFGRALAWMRERPEILPDHIAVVGTSRGGELALQLGSMYTHITAVVAYVPANVRYAACCSRTGLPAWTWQGHPLAYYVPHSRSFPDPAKTIEALIRVEQTHGPILLISGEDDAVWSSSLMAKAIVTRLKETHFPYRVEHLKYSHAGHLAGRPEIVPDWRSGGKPGGTARGDAESSIDAIPKVLEFLRTSLEAGAPVR
jgi:dienelactone hydrolase